MGYLHEEIEEYLRPQLSQKATVTSGENLRWSKYKAPAARTMVHVYEEQDVVAIIKYCNDKGLKFLAQTGGHGWANTYDMAEKDVIINMRGLNNIAFNKDDMTVTFGGGTIISELQAVLFANGAETTIGTCNTVGVMGAFLGGGLGRLLGKHGLSIDNLLSVRLITASGSIVTVSPTSHPDSDIWWALKGAGHNFGIAVSATVQAYPFSHDNGTVWSGPLIYTPDKFGRIAEAVNGLELKENMSCYFFIAAPPPECKPVALVNPVFYGSEEDARRAYKPLLDLEPFMNGTGMMSEEVFNAVSSDVFCEKGSYKQGMGRGLAKMDGAAFQSCMDLYVEFFEKNGWKNVGVSGMIVECYSPVGPRKTPASSACYPHRNINFHAIALPGCFSPEYCDAGIELSRKCIEILSKSSGIPEDKQQIYINFAFGDESLGEIYGHDNLERLVAVKKKWDPLGKFSQFFPIKEAK